jgi:hypothetical protein
MRRSAVRGFAAEAAYRQLNTAGEATGIPRVCGRAFCKNLYKQIHTSSFVSVTRTSNFLPVATYKKHHTDHSVQDALHPGKTPGIKRTDGHRLATAAVNEKRSER